MSTIYVVSDRQGVGKTAVSVGLAGLLTKLGKKVSVLKPFGIGTDDPDRTILLNASSVQQTGSLSWPLPTSDSETIDQEFIEKTLSNLMGSIIESDIAIVEGFSGLDPVKGQLASQVAETLDALVVAVIGYSSNDQVLQECVNANRIFGKRLTGIVLNGLTKYKVREVRSNLVPKIEETGIKVLASIPEERILLGFSVDQIAEHLNGKFLVCEDKSDNFVEHYVIGGMVLDWGVLYFERFTNKAVIVRGDRPDIQMAALRTPTSCIVLTGGYSPIQYVEYEAREEGVPLIQVGTDTVETVEALEGLASCARFDHPIKTGHFLQLMTECGEWDGLYSLLGS